MRVFILDDDDVGLAFAMRCMIAGHEVRLYDKGLSGDGIVEKVDSWKPSMPWADLIVMTKNSALRKELKPFFKAGLPIFGANDEGAELELNREVGMQVLQDHDIMVPPFRAFSGVPEALTFVHQTRKAYACKPWGGTADKALSFVASSYEDTVFYLQRLQEDGAKGDFMLQEKIDGIEMGVAGWFGPGGWSQWVEENWEHKKLMNDDLGQNTGEQGTVLRYLRESPLFERLLRPLTQYLHDIAYVGNVSINCIIDENGIPWPLEFTMRLGWPAFNLEMALHTGDPAQWMKDLIEGRDTLEALPEIALGVVLTHGDYPICKAPEAESAGFPLRGISEEFEHQLYFQAVMQGKAPVRVGSRTWDARTLVTAGTYVMVVVGTGQTVRSAKAHAYDAAWQVNWPSNRMFRTDIGDRLEKQLMTLQELGYCRDMIY